MENIGYVFLEDRSEASAPEPVATQHFVRAEPRERA